MDGNKPVEKVSLENTSIRKLMSLMFMQCMWMGLQTVDRVASTQSADQTFLKGFKTAAKSCVARFKTVDDCKVLCC